MQKVNRNIFWLVMASETVHLFCCVLPSIVSVLSLLASLGVTGAVPLGLHELHHVMHDWEIPLITASAVILLAGWVLHYISWRLDCRNQVGCAHGPCDSKKRRTNWILWLATSLFFVNLIIYLGLHHFTAPVH